MLSSYFHRTVAPPGRARPPHSLAALGEPVARRPPAAHAARSAGAWGGPMPSRAAPGEGPDKSRSVGRSAAPDAAPYGPRRTSSFKKRTAEVRVRAAGDRARR